MIISSSSIPNPAARNPSSNNNNNSNSNNNGNINNSSLKQSPLKQKQTNNSNSNKLDINYSNERSSAFSVIAVICQFLFLAFFGGFARITSTSSSSSSSSASTFASSSYSFVSSSLLFLLCWTVLHLPMKALFVHSVMVFTITFALTVQCNLLFDQFWYSVFHEFTTSFEITTSLGIESVMAVFAMLMVAIDYIGIWRHWQIFVFTVPIVNFLWALNYNILRYGIKIFDGGAGLNCFLFSAATSLSIWVVCVRGNNLKHGGLNNNHRNTSNIIKQALYRRQQHYSGYTLSLFALVGVFLLWPSFNSLVSTLSSTQTSVLPAISASSLFSNTAYANTMLGLCLGTVLCFAFISREGLFSGYTVYSRQQSISVVVDCFLNAGVVCSCFVDLTLNPTVALTLVLISTMLTLLAYWHFPNMNYQNGLQHESREKQSAQTNFRLIVKYYGRAVFRIVMVFISCVIAAIVVASRQNNTTYTLLDTTTADGTAIYSKIAGLQIAGFFITLGIALITGLVTGLAVNLYLSSRSNQHVKLEQISKVQYKVEQSALMSTPSVQKSVVSHMRPPLKQRQQRVLTSHQPYLSDLNFLHLGSPYPSTNLSASGEHQLREEQGDIFPLFLTQKDNYLDEEQRARKMLKQEMLSRVKANYVSNNNYISVLNQKDRANVQTNNTGYQRQKHFVKPDMDHKHNRSTLIKDASIMRNYNLETNYVLKNNRKEGNSGTPKSSTSRIRDQSKVIASKQKETDKQLMPEFYNQHMKKASNPGSPNTHSQQLEPEIGKGHESKMNRSKTEKQIIASRRRQTIGTKTGVEVTYKMWETRNQQQRNRVDNKIQNSQSKPKQKQKQETKTMPILEAQQESQYRDKNVDVNRKLQYNQKQKSLKNKKIVSEKQKRNYIEDNGSIILEENQHSQSRHSQII